MQDRVDFLENSNKNGVLKEIQRSISTINTGSNVRGCNQKFPDWVDEEIYA
jgi:hypothetical protein